MPVLKRLSPRLLYTVTLLLLSVGLFAVPALAIIQEGEGAGGVTPGPQTQAPAPTPLLGCCVALKDPAGEVTSANVSKCIPLPSEKSCKEWAASNPSLPGASVKFDESKQCNAISACSAVMPQNCCKSLTKDLTKVVLCYSTQDEASCSKLVTSPDLKASFVSGNCSGQSDCEGKIYLGAAPAAPPAPPELPVKEIKPVVPKIQIPIPGLAPFTADIGSYKSGYAIPWIGQYIQAIYNWTLGIVTILAVVMIVVGGVRWVTAGGEPSRVSRAQETIKNAIFGLLIALGSYLVLWTLNPSLVKFESLQITTVEPKYFTYPATENTLAVDTPEQAVQLSGSAPAIGGQTSGGKLAAVPLFKQADPRWGSKIYGDPANDPNCAAKQGDLIQCPGKPNPEPWTNPPIYAEAACGPTSGAMVAKFYGKNVDPYKLGSWQAEHGERKCGCGGSPVPSGMFPDLKTERIKDPNQAYDLLSQGNPMLISTGNYKNFGGCFSKFQHWIVATGVDGDWVNINDPSVCGCKAGYKPMPEEIEVNDKAQGCGIKRMKKKYFLDAGTFLYVHPK